MASGPYPDPRRGTWSIQWWNGRRWTRTTVTKKRAGWKRGDAMPKTPPPEAKAALAEYVRKEQAARTRQGYHPDRLLKDFLGDYLEGYGVHRKAGSKLAAEKAVRVFLAWCDGAGVKKLEQVTSEVCHQWLDHRSATKSRTTKRPIAHATLKKERALLSGAWSEGLKRGQVERNPWTSVSVPGKPSQRKRGSWTPEQFDRILEVCKPWLRDFVVVGCYTGLRVDALTRIEWGDVRPARNEREKLGYLVVRPELDKAGKGYEVPIHPRLNEVLMRRFVHQKAEHNRILAGHSGNPLRSINATDKAIRRACKRAKLNEPDSPNHHCRRTFGRWAVLGHLTGRPIPMYIVSRWLGHASLQMTQRYLDLNEADSAAWMTSEGGEEPTMTPAT